MHPYLSRSANLTTIVAALTATGLTACAGPGALATAAAPKTCAELNGMTIASSQIGLPTTGAVVTSTEVVAAAGSGAKAVGEYCKVLGEISPVDASAPKIKFQVNLPAAWNSKAMMFGGGGYDGIMASVTGNVPAGPTDKPVPLGRGYATFGSDSGHQANATTLRDGSFGMNDEALKNFAGDALKKTRDVSIALINARYGALPQKTYFAGGSTGAREALVAVGNWPQDFDGAIAMYPAWNAVALNLQFGRITRELTKPGAYSNLEKRKLLYDAAIAACDKLDGVADGLISNVDACNASFDPATAVLNGAPLRCPGGTDSGNTCLSDAQIHAFKIIGTPIQLGYTLASGETTYPGFNVWGTNFGVPGTHALQPIVTMLGLGTVAPGHPMPDITASTSPPFHSTFWDQWVRYFLTRDTSFNSLTLDPQAPGPWQSRIIALNNIQDANKTGLSTFRDKGGKILIAHGTSDQLVSTQASRQYMQRIRHAMGSDTVDSFMRYYEIPGYAHVVSPAFHAGWDSLTALEHWVEKGIAPQNLVVADSAGVPGRTRPLCEYPSWPKYKGSGDANAAASFVCAMR